MAEEVLLNLLHSLSETLLQFVPVCVQVGGVGGVSGGWRDVEAVESRECRLQCFHDNLRLLCGGGHLRVDVSLERYFCPVLVEREADDVAQEPDESGEVELEFLCRGGPRISPPDCHTPGEVGEHTAKARGPTFMNIT